MAIFNKHSIRFVIPFLVFAVLGGKLAAQQVIYLEARDDFNGKGLPAEFRIESVSTKNSYTIKNENERKYIEMSVIEAVQIKILYEGYYVEDRLLKPEDIDTDPYTFRVAMQRRPTAKLKVKAVKTVGKSDVPASFDIYYQGKMVGRGKTTKSEKFYEVVLIEEGNFEVVVNAQGYNETKKLVAVKVGVPIKVIEEQIELNEPASQIAINLVDAKTNNSVDAEVKISTSEEVADIKANGGKANYKFEDGKSYIIEVKAAGYEPLKTSIVGSQHEDLTLKLKPKTVIHFVVTDIETQKPVQAHIAIADAQRKQTELDGYEYTPSQKGVYNVIVSGPKYFQTADTLVVEDMFQGRIDYPVKMSKELIPYAVTVIDHYTKEVIPQVDFRVFASEGKLKIRAIEDKGAWVFNTEPGKEYFLEASKSTYLEQTKMVPTDNQKFTVELIWAPEYIYTIRLIDKEENKTITKASLKVEDQNKNKLFVYQDTDNERFLVKIDKNQMVSYLAKADGYRADPVDVKTDEKHHVDLYLARADSRSIIFEARDYLTNQTLSPTLRYLKNDKSIELSVSKNGTQFTGQISGAGTYRVEAKLTDYQNANEDIDVSKGGSEPYVLKLKKNFYTVKIVVENFKTDAERNGLKLYVSGQTGKEYPERWNGSLGKFEVDLPLGSPYTLEVNKTDFEPHKRSFNLEELVSANMEIVVNLKEIPKPIVETPKTEEPVVKVEEKPKTPPVTIEEVFETPAATLPKPEEMAAEFTKKESIGKRYVLDQVYFDQSRAVIRDSEVPQLNELAARLKENPKLVIAIVGHIDNVGDYHRNEGLSKLRAKAVANYLFYKGADPKRIQSDGMGSDKPIGPNDTDENKSKNRRVEMVLIEN